MPSQSVEIAYVLQQIGTEIRTTTDIPTATNDDDRTVRHNQFNATGNLSANTTPVVDTIAYDAITLGAGITTVDLTAAETVNGTEDLTGKKLVGFIVEAHEDNTGVVTVAFGAANPYPLFGTSNKITLNPGETLAKTIRTGSANANPAVAAGVKDIDISSTFATDVLNIQLIFGT